MKKKERFKINLGRLSIEAHSPGKNTIIIIVMALIFVLALVILLKAK